MNYTKYLIKISQPLFLSITVLIPLVVFSASDTLTTCNGADCDFAKFIELIKNVINFMILKLALPLAAISFAVAGIMLLTAGGDTEKIKKAKEIFHNVLIGIIIALSAWLVVNTITSALLTNGISLLG